MSIKKHCHSSPPEEMMEPFKFVFNFSLSLLSTRLLLMHYNFLISLCRTTIQPIMHTGNLEVTDCLPNFQHQFNIVLPILTTRYFCFPLSHSLHPIDCINVFHFLSLAVYSCPSNQFFLLGLCKMQIWPYRPVLKFIHGFRHL